MTSYKYTGLTGPGSDVVAWLATSGYNPDEMAICGMSWRGYLVFVLDENGNPVTGGGGEYRKVRRRWHSLLDWFEFKHEFSKWLVRVD